MRAMPAGFSGVHNCGRRLSAALVAGSAMALAGCGADLGQSLQVNAVTGYEASSAFSPTGHSVAALADGRYRITATGSSSTPKSRVEKIAIARAAEFGAEQKKKFFQTSVPQTSIRCRRRDYIERGEKKMLPIAGYSVVELDVTYADIGGDPSFRPVKDTVEALKAELASEVVADDARNQAAADVRAQCGG